MKPLNPFSEPGFTSNCCTSLPQTSSSLSFQTTLWQCKYNSHPRQITQTSTHNYRYKFRQSDSSKTYLWMVRMQRLACGDCYMNSAKVKDEGCCLFDSVPAVLPCQPCRQLVGRLTAGWIPVLLEAPSVPVPRATHKWAEQLTISC